MSEEKGAPVDGWPAESAQRHEKADTLRSRGIDPYPTRFLRTHSFGEILSTHRDQTLEELESLAVPVRIAGRVMLSRPMGKASFVTLSDGEHRLQVYVRKDGVGESAYAILGLVDRGDFVGVSGKVMRTRAGELSVQASELVFLGKALLPPPRNGTASATRRAATANATWTSWRTRRSARPSFRAARWSPRSVASWMGEATSRSRPR